MKAFKELEIRGIPSGIAGFADAAEKLAVTGWRRDRTAEMEAGPNMSCFVCERTGSREAAAIWLSAHDKPRLWLSNIVPTELSRLSFDQYNRVVDDFSEQVAKPVAERLGLKVFVGQGEIALTDLLSPRAFELLKLFSAAANKSTGSRHPLDGERWMAFVIAAHRDGANLSPSLLARWLFEDARWSPDVAGELAAEYESYRELLRRYDVARG